MLRYRLLKHLSTEESRESVVCLFSYTISALYSHHPVRAQLTLLEMELSMRCPFLCARGCCWGAIIMQQTKACMKISTLPIRYESRLSTNVSVVHQRKLNLKRTVWHPIIRLTPFSLLPKADNHPFFAPRQSPTGSRMKYLY